MLKKAIIIFSSFFVLFSCTTEDPLLDNSDSRDKFAGTWQCKENSRINGTSSFTVIISKDSSNSSQVKIANFYMYGLSEHAIANVSGRNISIPKQTLCNNLIHGDGYIDNSETTINFEYVIDDGSGEIDSCTAIFTKK